MTENAGTPIILRIRVVDDQRQAIMDASVLFRDAPIQMPDIAALTDGNGEVVLAAPVAGLYTIETAAPGYLNATFPIDIGSSGEEALEIVMTRAGDGD